jgi:hypothetical protein
MAKPRDITCFIKLPYLQVNTLCFSIQTRTKMSKSHPVEDLLKALEKKLKEAPVLEPRFSRVMSRCRN